jgi:hypothetical protein
LWCYILKNWFWMKGKGGSWVSLERRERIRFFRKRRCFVDLSLLFWLIRNFTTPYFKIRILILLFYNSLNCVPLIIFNSYFIICNWRGTLLTNTWALWCLFLARGDLASFLSFAYCFWSALVLCFLVVLLPAD